MTDRYLAILIRIRELRLKGEEISSQTVTDGLRDADGNILKRNTVNIYLGDMKERLLQLLYNPAKDTPDESFFLQDEEPISVIAWLEQSGVIPVVESYLALHPPTPKKRAGKRAAK